MRQILWLIMHKDLGDHEQSKALFRKSLAIYESNQSKIARARLFRNMGGIHLLEGQLEEAQNIIDKSLEILRNHPETYLPLENFAKLCLKRSDQAVKEGNTIQSQNFRDQAIDQLNQDLQGIKGYFP